MKNVKIGLIALGTLFATSFMNVSVNCSLGGGRDGVPTDSNSTGWHVTDNPGKAGVWVVAETKGFSPITATLESFVK